MGELVFFEHLFNEVVRTFMKFKVCLNLEEINLQIKS